MQQAYPLIGTGTFSRVYRKDTKTVLVKSCDPVKECMALGWFPNDSLFPSIERVDWEEYEMPFYPIVRKPSVELTSRSYRLYQALRRWSKELFNVRHNSDLIAATRELPFKREAALLREVIDALSNYGDDVMFEISPRNISRTPRRKLVLLDCFFLRSKLNEVCSK